MKIKGLLASIIVGISALSIPMSVNAETVEGVEGTKETNIADNQEKEVNTNDFVSILFSMPLTRSVDIGNTKIEVSENARLDVQDTTGEILFTEYLNDIADKENATSYQYFGTVDVPSWEIGDTYIFNFFDLPPEYAEGITFKNDVGSKSIITLDTIKNENGNYNASVEVKSFMGSATVMQEDGSMKDIDVKVGIDSPLQFNVNREHVFRTQYLVLDKNNEIIDDVEVWVTTDKGKYKSTGGDCGLNMVFFQSDKEELKQYDIYYNENLIYSELATESDQISGALSTKFFKLYDIDNETLRYRSNYLTATISNPEKVDFSLMGSNGNLGIELELKSKKGDTVKAKIDGTGSVKLLDGVVSDVYTISVINDKGINLEFSEKEIEVKGNTEIEVKLKAKKILALTNKDSNDIEKPFKYYFSSNTVLGSKEFSSDYMKYYAVTDGTYSITNVETSNVYSVDFYKTDKNRVKVLNLFNGTITETDKVVILDSIFNPDTSDRVIFIVLLNVLCVAVLGSLLSRKLKK